MRRFIVGISLFGLLQFGLLIYLLNAFAESQSAPTIRVVADVKDALEIKVDLRKDTVGFPDLANDTLIDFGALIPSSINKDSLVAETGVVAFIYVNSHRVPYTVYSYIGSPLTSGVEVMPNGAFVLNSSCVDADQPYHGTCEGTAGYSGTAVGNKIVYRSGGRHRASVSRATYMITDDSSQGSTEYVPADQYGGTYETALVITVVR